MFCQSDKRVADMVGGKERVGRFFGGVTPAFLHRGLNKEERMQLLEDFKNGKPNANGVRERLLVTSEDYAKLAQKNVMPYVNLIINFSVPRTEEFYVLQSMVAGRHGTVGASFLIVNDKQDEFAIETDYLKKIERDVDFTVYTKEEDFSETAQCMTYDTVTEPLTLPTAYPPADWREHLNDAKPPKFHKRK
ncbi:hypothetical protein STCU_04009 [Strigomonas culicis]|nr:hypothetical protein STCU_04009 [Strigomonas culicis]|eukprot:EPY30553.1 hypothetical protein STCU_04009 [Strigomonas culicis]